MAIVDRCVSYDGSFKVLQHGDKSLVVVIEGPTSWTPPSTLSPWSVWSSFNRDGVGCVPGFPPLSPCHLYSERSGHHSFPEWGF
uniref:Uncharacterized protein n=1 Tax=Knipowitschia caucasica TaxID=637954 RepID=A0AAV2M682_KNICA